MTKWKALIWACIVVVGFPLGYFGRGLVHRPADRAEAALSLFETYCIPFASQMVKPPERSLVRIENVGELVWADPDTALFLQYRDEGCSVSDVLRPMTADEREALDSSVTSFIEQELPVLYPDENHGLDTWDVFHVWAQYPVRDKRRWAVSYGRFLPEPEWETQLTISYPKSDDVSEKLHELRKGS